VDRVDNLPGGVIAQTVVEHLAFPNKVVKRADRFLDWCDRVGSMKMDHVEVIRCQTPKTFVYCSSYRSTAGATGSGVMTAFRGDYESVPASLDRLAKYRFALAVIVDIGSVDEVEAEFCSSMDEPLPVSPRAEVESTGAQTDAGNAQTAPGE
jgi:hypothetical protein